MKAILLCAGFGTRMYPLTKDRAKPLLPVAGKPVIEHLVEQLEATTTFAEIVIVANDRFHHQFAAWGGDRIVVLNDGATSDDNRLGAVRDLAWAVEERGVVSESVLVAAGDNLFRDTIGPFVTDYDERPRNLVLCYREPERDKLERTGVAEIDERGRLVRLEEKPARPSSDWACPALYILESDALAELGAFLKVQPRADALGSYIAWLAPRVPVFTHEMRGNRLDVGELQGYARAESWFTNGV